MSHASLSIDTSSNSVLHRLARRRVAKPPSLVSEWTHDVARVVRVESDRLRAQLGRNEITNPDEKSIDWLRKVGTAIDELPIWPFDPSTLRKFATAYVVPVALPLLGEAVHKLLNAIGLRLGGA